MIKPIIDTEFYALIPPLSDDERIQLEANIRAEGCRDALVTWEGILLDGHNRLEICERLKIEYQTKAIKLKDRATAADWIDRNQLGRRNLTPDQMSLLRGRRYNRGKKAANDGGRGTPKSTVDQNEPRFTADRLAKEHGVSPATIKRDAKFAEEVERSPELQKAVWEHRPVSRAKKEVKAKADKVDLEEAQKTITEGARKKLASVCDIRACSCADLFKSGIKPDAVITDPPYPKEFLDTFSELAESCKNAHVPLVAVMSGQSHLPEVLRRLCEHLAYRWTLAYLTPGGQAVQCFPSKVNTFWKPVFLFGESAEWIGDVAASKANDNDKRFHGWGQSESGMYDLIERLTKPGQLVCDPFLGGGTTALVSLALGRRFVGCDIDAESVEKARQRIEVAICKK